MRGPLKLVRVRYPGSKSLQLEVLQSHRDYVANAFSDAAWHDADQLPKRPENALYFLYVTSDASESPQDFITQHGRPPPEVCERIIVEVAFRGYIWRLMREFGFAAAWGIDYGVIGRLDVMQRYQPSQEHNGPWHADGTPVAPNHTYLDTHIAGPEASIAAYFKALVEVLDEKPPPATPG